MDGELVLAKQQSLNRLNRARIDCEWRKLMRMAKTEALQQDIAALSQAHEREVDRKDAVIHMLSVELDEAETQYHTALRAQIKCIDALIRTQTDEMSALDDGFMARLRAFGAEFGGELAVMTQKHTTHIRDLGAALTALQAEYRGAQAEAQQAFESAREEVRNRNSEEYNVLKISLEGQREDLERQFEQAHHAYTQANSAKTEAYCELTEKDRNSARVIEKRMRRLIKLQEGITHWRTKFTSNTRHWEARNRSLREEKESMNRHLQELKRRLNKTKEAEHTRLTVLSTESEKCMKVLAERIELAQRILSLAQVSRKYETEQEKVTPFGSVGPQAIAAELKSKTRSKAKSKTRVKSITRASVDDTKGQGEEEQGQGENEEARPEDASSPLPAASLANQAAEDGQDENEEGGDGEKEEGEEEEEEEDISLKLFFCRYNKVLLDKTSLERRLKSLKTENDRLRKGLQQFCDGVSVTDSVMKDSTNPLLVINGRRQQHMRATVDLQLKPPPNTKIEAAHIVKNMAQLYQ